MVNDSKSAVRGAGRVGFLARLEGIKKMIEEGHPLLSIYQQYENDLSISYSQFVKYVHKFIRSKLKDENKSVTTDKKGIIKKPEYGPPRFKSTENRDDLIHPPKPKQ